MRRAIASDEVRALRRLLDVALQVSPAAAQYNVVKAAIKPTRRRTRKDKNVIASSMTSPSMCLKKFICASFRPFSEEAKGACVPAGSVASSARYYFRGQFTVVIGTTGVGFAHIMPTMANNQAVAFYSLAGFARTDCAITNGANVTYNGNTRQWVSGVVDPNIGIAEVDSGISSGTLLTGLGAGADYPSFAQRLVGGGVAVSYIGTELYRSGQIYAYTSPVHASSGTYGVGGATAINEAQISGIQEAFQCPMTRQRTLIPLPPVSDQELLFSNEITDGGQNYENTNIVYPYSGGDSVWPGTVAGNYTVSETTTSVNTGVPTLTLLFTGYAGEKVLVEYGFHFEAVGSITNGMAKHPADADPVGVEKVQAAYQRFNTSRKRESGVDAYNEFHKYYDAVSAAMQPTKW